MLKQERQKFILEILEAEQKVIASDLSTRLSVSEDTVRRDLNELDREGLLRRVHRGALRIGPAVTNYEYRQNFASDEKIRLAKKALPFLKENSVILIDGSTTNHSLVSLIPSSFTATIITNSPPIAIALNQHHNIEVIVLGGQYETRSMITLGATTLDTLQHIRADLYIMGVHNIDSHEGLTVNTQTEAVVKRRMLSVSTEVLCMITGDKVETFSNFIHAKSDDITYLITEGWSDQTLSVYKRLEIPFIIA